MEQFKDIPLFRICWFQQKPFIQNQDNRIGILSHDFFVTAICPCHLQINKQIRKTDILGIEILLTSLHAKGTDHVSFTAACSTSDKKILLFHTFGGQYCIDHSIRVYTNPFSPFAEAIAILLQILLVVFWHMLCNGAVLPRASFQTTVGSDAVMVVKNFNGGICYLYINFLFDVFIWN